VDLAGGTSERYLINFIFHFIYLFSFERYISKYRYPHERNSFSVFSYPAIVDPPPLYLLLLSLLYVASVKGTIRHPMYGAYLSRFLPWVGYTVKKTFFLDEVSFNEYPIGTQLVRKVKIKHHLTMTQQSID
jgi:hypothetical protein